MSKKNQYKGCGISATLIGLGRFDLAVVKDMTFAWDGDENASKDILVFVNQARDKFCCSFYSGGTTGMGQNQYDFYDMNKKRHNGKPCYKLVKVFKSEKEVVEYLNAEEGE